MKPRRLELVAAFLIASLSSTATAQSTGAPPAPTPASEPLPAQPLAPTPATTTEKQWYGWEPLAIDLAASLTAVAVAAVASNDTGHDFTNSTLVPAGATLSAGAYLFGGPAVHLLRGHPGKAGASFALRLLLPIFSGAIGYAIGAELQGSADSSHERVAPLYPAACALVVAPLGMIAASVIDAAALSRDEAPVSPHDAKPTFQPQISFVVGGATAGIGGTF